MNTLLFNKDMVYLFTKQSLSIYFDTKLKQVRDEISTISEDKFIANSDDEILDYVFNRLKVAPLLLKRDKAVLVPENIKVNVQNDKTRAVFNRNQPRYIPGYRLIVRIPYEGHTDLWYYEPRAFTSIHPRGNIDPLQNSDCDGIFEIYIELPSDSLNDTEKIRSIIDQELKNVQYYIANSTKDVDQYNDSLRNKIQNQIFVRRKELQQIGKIAESLEIPLIRKKEAPDLNEIELKKKTIPSLKTSKNESVIPDDHYEYILKVIRHEGKTYETTPGTYQKMDEEDLRNIILAHLNGHYEGLASGETFRKSGKTDIKIEFENRAAFVAECKIWRGQKEIMEAFDQLLGYLTWRDCKASLIIFNKNRRNFTNLQSTIPQVIKEHPKYLEEIKIGDKGEWRFKVKSKDDDERRITIHVFLFDLFIKAEKK